MPAGLFSFKRWMRCGVVTLGLLASLLWVGCAGPGAGGGPGSEGDLPTLGELQPAEPIYDIPPQPEPRQRLVKVDRPGRDANGDDGQSARGAMMPTGTSRQAGSAGLRVQRLAFARDDYRVDLALDFADRNVLPPELAELWEANGLHVGSVPRDRLALFEANLPPPHRIDLLHLTPTREWQPVALIGRIESTQVARLHRLDPVKSPADIVEKTQARLGLIEQTSQSEQPDRANPKPRNRGQAYAEVTQPNPNAYESGRRTESSDTPAVQTMRFRGGEHRLLLKLARTLDPSLGAGGEMRLHLLPQHHRVRQTLLPRMPQEKITDGQLFKRLTLRAAPPEDHVWLIWGDPPRQSPLHRDPTGEARDADRDTDPASETSEGMSQQRNADGARPETDRVESPNLGQLMFNGRHRKGSVRLVVVIAPMAASKTGPVLEPPVERAGEQVGEPTGGPIGDLLPVDERQIPTPARERGDEDGGGKLLPGLRGGTP